jgi:predicted Zn-ribbon and HTH transcriptional regulator
MPVDLDDDYEETERKSYWFCDECGFEDKNKLMPPDRDKFYDKVHKNGSPKCPKCKSESFMPKGF